jgi:hypothetical protein
VTCITGLWEVLADVVSRTAVVAGMAVVAIRRNRPERAAGVALNTVQSTVAAGQGQTAMRVGGRRPRRNPVALLTRLRVVVSDVIGSRGIIRRMTRVAICGDRPDDTTGVTGRAIQSPVPAGQWEDLMWERQPRPGRGCMASLASGGPAVCSMVW